MGLYANSAAVAILGGIAMYFGLNPPSKTKKPIGDDDVKIDDPPVGPTLLKVAFVFRHGDRAPLNELPGESLIADDLWADGRGELTKIGKKNSYLLGKRLRKRYDAILTPHYSKTNLHVVSTKVERTMMSALLVLAGMYPPKDHQRWSETIPWVPIPVYHDSVFNKNTCFACPRFKYEVLKALGSNDKGKFAPLVALATERGHEFKNPKQTWKELVGIYDIFNLKKRMGLPTPDWADEFLRLGGDPMNDAYYSVTAKTEVQKQLASSLTSDYLLQFLDDPRKVSMFSAHDLTLYMLSGSLGFGMMRPPLPTACIAVEVHEKNGRKVVKAFYITESIGPMVPIEMGCGTECELSKFIEMVNKVKPEDYQALCHDVPGDIDIDSDPDLSRFLNDLAYAEK